MHVLMVEDDPHKKTDLAKCVTRRDWNLTCAVSVNEAKRLIRTESFDLLLLDMVLPTFSQAGGGQQAQGGHDIMRTVAKYKAELPVILVTQYPDVEVQGATFPVKKSVSVLRYQYKVNLINAIHFDYKNQDWFAELEDAIESYFL